VAIFDSAVITDKQMQAIARTEEEETKAETDESNARN